MDANRNGLLDDPETLTAVKHWITGDPIPGTAERVDDSELLGLLGIWINQTPIPQPSPQCTCTVWQPGSCVDDNHREYLRTCTPSGCDQEYKIIEDDTCQPTPPAVDTAFLTLINQYRSQSNQCWDPVVQAWVLWPASASRNLTLSSSLNDAAVYHSQFMADHDCFAHQCPGEADLRARIEQFGYTGWSAYGENIAAGMEISGDALEAWRNSPPHNRNMLTCQFQEIGVGRVHDLGDQYPTPQVPYRWYWTTDFGSR